MAFVQALRQRQGGFGGKTKPAIGLALQTGQIEQARAAFAAGFAFFGDGGGLLAHRVGNGLGLVLRPDPVFFFLGVVRVFFVLRVKPFASVSTGGSAKLRMDFPVIPADEFANQLFALDHHAQGGGLYPAHGGEEKTAVARVKRSESAGTVDADQPIGFGAAARRVGQALHLRGGAQTAKAVAYGLRRHGLQPQALDWLIQRFFAASVLFDQAEDQLAFSARVTGVDDGADIFALGLLDHSGQARLGFLHRLQIEIRRNHRQMGKTPFAAFHVKFFGCLNFHQVTDRAGDHIRVIFKMIVVLFKFARARCERLDDVLRN